jgi:mannose-6-phosphate isomerase-like protein (cupin superfamily)
MDLICRNEIVVLSNSGVESHQLLFPENSSSSRVTVTKVVVAPGAVNPLHRHESSGQIWVAISGGGIFLLGDERVLPFQEGDVVRFAESDFHGFKNTGAVAFVYMSVTSPPINFRQTYGKSWSRGE